MSTPDAARQRLRDLRGALLELHRLLLEAQRRELQRDGPAIAGGETLQAAIGDIRFAWVQPLTTLIAQLDETLAAEDLPVSAAATARARARDLVAPPDPATAFGMRYLRALQEDPAVVLAHRDVTALL